MRLLKRKGSLDDEDLYKIFLIYVRDFKREKPGVSEMEVAVALRKVDDEALATADLMTAMMGADRLH